METVLDYIEYRVRVMDIDETTDSTILQAQYARGSSCPPYTRGG